MKSSNEIKAKIAELDAKVAAIAAIAKEENREPTAEEFQVIDSILGANGKQGEIDALNAELERAIKFESRVSANLSRQVTEREAPVAEERQIRIPATARRNHKLTAFANNAEGERDAYVSGQFLRAVLGNNASAKQWLRDHGIQNVMTESDDYKGGILVPPQFENAIINLKEEYGVFGRYVRNVPMTSDMVTIPRRLAGVTAYAVGEGSEITASDVTMNGVQLVARKWGTLTRLSSELSEDAIISMADFLAQEMAYAHAVKEDQCGFLGDASTTYHGIYGLDNALAAGSVSTATSTTIGALTLTECEACVAKLPMYPGIRPVWFVHSSLYWNGLARLQVAAGGNSVMDVGNGPVMQFLGYPVVFTQCLSSAGTTGTTYAFFGDLSMTATKGNRRGVTIAADSSRYFELDQIAVRSTLRYDINVHEVGTASAAGPMIKCKLG